MSIDAWPTTRRAVLRSADEMILSHIRIVLEGVSSTGRIHLSDGAAVMAFVIIRSDGASPSAMPAGNPCFPSRLAEGS
jgi:hypothetical protein